ncbi:MULTISPECIES: GNAT family N-acetyltransferase [Thalassospira]|jgi:predicted GNAT family acetyltransferase|uniref:GCN5 family acetyltransferase n=2 Tax=Thalassospira xiamenensis TaxID=220697 RepID=A0ABR5Y6M7_9PROT|nr:MULTISPECIES: GNAT family N-acetyltransferase [Thalassospira]MAL28073.1 N-acetyltransferase [Thalassospira sp.]MBR9780780.1 GNAT family N-acetyltransferase [Rhodospirillales bacterium]KZD06922.1 GCN5 family acetyltransferase [Thalassospira xiamenensis]KZD09212.1 GCN5 family acetyltransferase [Thalassospira xiamenensis]MBL4840388.1 GNAT family N-acetyltransferase [Thalassospira sp.]|tara:strand:+ start:20291 stop:21151 length:861 start_codon:yes stop_codon:yes gene_type:complete
MQYRKLHDTDFDAATAFLAKHSATCMVLRGNLRAAGIERRRHPLSGNWFGEVAPDGGISAIVAQFGNGKVFVEVGDQKAIPKGLTAAFIADPLKPVSGVFGDADAAQDMLCQLGLEDAAYAINVSDVLYELDLSNLIVPQNARADDFQMVDAEKIDRNTLLRWLRAYEIEALGAEDTPSLDSKIASRLVHALDARTMWGLIVDGKTVSLSGFNAIVPDMVQVGPVWTPPEERSNGYARILVAKTLLAVRARGVKRAILSTDSDAAAKAYEALGFEKVGRYRLALLK